MIRKSLLVAVFCLPALGACATDQPLPGPVAQVGFAHLAPLAFNVNDIQVTSVFASPMQPPHAEQRMSTTPEQAMRDWANTRLKAAGGPASSAHGVFTIEDASVIETKLAKTTGFKGMLTNEPSERFEAKAVATFVVTSADGSAANVRVSANRTIELHEDATLAEREQAWMSLVETLMADFNAQMEQQLPAYLGPWMMR